MDRASGDPDLARYAEAARRVEEGGCAWAPDSSPFGAAHYVYGLDATIEIVELARQPTEPLDGGLSNAIIRATKPGVGTRPMEPADWSAVRTIYEGGIASGHAEPTPRR